MEKSRVFAPQLPSRFDDKLRLWVPTVSLNRARQYGEVVVILPPEAVRLHVAPMVQAIKEAMVDYGAQDYLVAIGDPSMIAAAACIAARKTGGVLRLLKWDRETSDYLLVEINV